MTEPTLDDADVTDDAAAETTETPDAEPGAEVIPHPSRELVKGTLAVEPYQNFWTDEQLAALRTLGLENVPNADLASFLHLVQRSGLDPFAREVYLIGRWDRDAPNNTRYTVQTGIEGFRHIAERTGEYDGREGPWWCGQDGIWRDVWLEETPPAAAKVKIYRVGMRLPVEAIAHYREFVPMYKPRNSNDEKPMPMWQKMPSHMLAKCAEALAIRQAFPRQTNGIYSDDEMGRHDNETRTARETDRAEARRTYRREQQPEGPGDDASPRDTAPGDIIDGELVEPLDREALLAELTEQARVLGKSVAQHGTRWAAVHKRNIVDASDAEIEAFLASQRPRVAEARAQQATDVAEVIDTVAETTVIPDDDEQDGFRGVEDVPLPGEAAPQIDVTAPHVYQDWGGKCIVCTGAPDDPVHVEGK